MDSLQWHRHCVANDPSEPLPMTRSQWARLSDPELDRCRAELRLWIRNLHIETPELAGIESALTAVVDANCESRPGAKQFVTVTGANAL